MIFVFIVPAMTNNVSTDGAFAAIISRLDQSPRCEVTINGVRCSVPARWHVTCHECSRGLVCALHLRALMRQAGAEEAVECRWCGRVFGSIDQAVTAVAL